MKRPLTSELVPTERHVEASALARTSAKTFRRAVGELREAAEPGLQPTTPEVTRLLTARLTALPVAQAAALDDALGRLRRAGTRPVTLRRVAVGRAADFAALLDDANAVLEERKLADDREAPWVAAARLRAADDDATSLYEGRVHVSGLCRWDNATLAFLMALHGRLRARGGDGVCLEIPAHDSLPLANAAAAVTSDLETRWADENDAPALLMQPVSTLSSAPLALVEAHDAASEARAVARAVLEGIERGIPIEQIAVVSPDLAEAFLEPLRFELCRAKIPFSEPRGRPAIAAPRAHAALALLRLAEGPIQRDVVRDLLSLPGIRGERWFGSARAELATLAHELLVLPMRVERQPGELLQELADRVAEREADEVGSAERLAAAQVGLGRWLDELARLGGVGARREHAARARTLFDELGLFQPRAPTLASALERAERGRAELLAGLGHDAVAAAAVEAAMEKTTAAAAALGHDVESVPLGRWLDELELSLTGVAPGRGAARAAAVRVARPEDVAGLELGLVVLCRASDASLDRSPNVELVLGSELLAALPLAERPPSSAIEQHFRTLGIAGALARAREVVVTWARREGTTTLAPSRLARALSQKREPRQEPASSLAPKAHRVVPLPEASDGARARSAIELGRLEFYANPSARADATNGLAGDLSSAFGGARPVAVTALEAALRCPFFAFAVNVLKAARKDPVSDAIGTRERGSLLHEALARALEATRSLWGLRSPAELTELGMAAARTYVLTRGRTPLRRIGLESTLCDVRAMLAQIFASVDEVGFRLAEQAFGDGAPWPALAAGGTRLAGRIDRIDQSNDGAKLRVIDYKTNLPKLDDTQLQPWLYAHKAASELGASQVEFAYLSLEKRSPRLKVIYEGPPLGEAVAIALERAERVAEQLGKGGVAARPSSPAHCPRCDARDICRRPLSAPAPEADD